MNSSSAINYRAYRMSLRNQASLKIKPRHRNWPASGVNATDVSLPDSSAKPCAVESRDEETSVYQRGFWKAKGALCRWLQEAAGGWGAGQSRGGRQRRTGRGAGAAVSMLPPLLTWPRAGLCLSTCAVPGLG